VLIERKFAQVGDLEQAITLIQNSQGIRALNWQPTMPIWQLSI